MLFLTIADVLLENLEQDQEHLEKCGQARPLKLAYCKDYKLITYKNFNIIYLSFNS